MTDAERLTEALAYLRDLAAWTLEPGETVAPQMKALAAEAIARLDTPQPKEPQ